MSTRHINFPDRKVLQEKNVAQASAQLTGKEQNHLAVIIALISIYILWGGTYLGMRIALQGFPPFLLAGTRNLTAGVLMFAFLRARGAPVPARKEWLGAALIGALLLIGGNAGVTFAEQWVASGLAAVAIGAVPLWAALFAGFFGRWPTRFEWYGLVLGFAGLLLLNLGHGLASTNPLGTIVLLIAPISWALGSVLSRRVPLPKGFMATAAQLLCGGALLLIIGLATGERMTRMPAPAAIWAMLFLIGGGSLIAYTAYGYLLNHVRASLATSYAYVNPVVAVGLGVWLAGEQISLIGLIAMLIILSGVVLVTLGQG
ncbi:MAG TPA: drug/metabolite exporter YedA [Ktedonobacteraceae bacterium]|nr:drug/metabolite exporter YedA [Ktedonobacteraceae bacterium]